LRISPTKEVARRTGRLLIAAEGAQQVVQFLVEGLWLACPFQSLDHLTYASLNLNSFRPTAEQI